MILQSIMPHNFGPFAIPSMLNIEPDVTVLTGPNDAGKSLTLRVIEILCSGDAGREQEINTDHYRDSSKSWKDDGDVFCNAVFRMTGESGQMSIDSNNPNDFMRDGDIVTVRCRLNQDSGTNKVLHIERENQRLPNVVPIKRWPNILRLPPTDTIRDVIDMVNPTTPERQFLEIAFGQSFLWGKFRDAGEGFRSHQVEMAEQKLTDRLKSVLPNLQIKLRETAAKPEELRISLKDSLGGYVPLSSRGLGIRRILNVVWALLRVDTSKGNTIVLYDEPEVSLHADNQHILRRLLEQIGSSPAVQVIYTTHSPAMINTMRPSSIRVIQRENKDGKPTATFENSAFTQNYAMVRTSLGMSPADSLLFSSVTLVVEGATETLGLPIILTKLADAGKISKEALELIFPQLLIQDGEGSSFAYACRMVIAQRATPIVFLDGDKQKEAKQLKEAFPNILIHILPEGREFEDLIPPARYFEALRMVFADDSLTEQAFQEWKKTAKMSPTKLFSKQVEHWLYEGLGITTKKPRIMERAIELTPGEEINPTPFTQIVEDMLRFASK